MRPDGVRARAGWVAAVGALAAVPSLVWPTAQAQVRPPDMPGVVQDGSQAVTFQMWSWGRLASEEFSRDGAVVSGSVAGLLLLGGAILLALVAVVVLVVSRRAAATPIGAAGIGLALATVGGNVADRVLRGGSFFGQPGVQVEISATPAGLLEVGSVALLSLALVLLLAGPVRLTAGELRVRFPGRVRSDASAPASTVPGPAAPVVRDGGLREGRRTAGPAQGVGFSDD